MPDSHYAALDAARREFARYPNLQAIVLGCIAGNFRDWPLVKQELIQYVAERGQGMQKDWTDPPPVRDNFEDEILAAIQSWTLERGWNGLLDYVAQSWDSTYGRCVSDSGAWEFTTGGWSENEAIITALYQNRMFWISCWASSSRGGHHVFTDAQP